jgi:3',5'-cyclic AMP phosphodiesterase CpdA
VTASRAAALLAALLLWVGAALAQVAQVAPDERRGATRVVVLSDFNESYGSLRYSPHVDEAVSRTVTLKPDLVISTGDMVAGQRLAPPLSREQLDAMWQSFHARVSEPLARAGLPFAVTPGNHDASSGGRFALERATYREQWLPRRPGLEFVDARHYPFHYAFRAGDVLFASLDATHVGHLSRAQKDWLRDLLAGPGARARHRVVFSHIPLWPFAVGRETEFLGDPELEAILQRGRVDVHLSGHHHAFYPGYKDGVRYVSQGCLGAAPRPLLGSPHPSDRSLTLIDFDADGTIRIEALRASDFRSAIARSELPPRIESPRATIVRDDLAAPMRATSPGR